MCSIKLRVLYLDTAVHLLQDVRNLRKTMAMRNSAPAVIVEKREIICMKELATKKDI